MRVGGGLKNGPLVILQYPKPASDICGVVLAGFNGDAKIGAKKCASEFCYKLLARVTFIAETLAPQVAVKAALVFGPVR